MDNKSAVLRSTLVAAGMLNKKIIALAALLLGAASVGSAYAQSPYSLGDRVQLRASGNRWQTCTVTDPGSDRAVMRMRCDAYDDGVYSRGAGVFTESYDSTSVRLLAEEATVAPTDDLDAMLPFEEEATAAPEAIPPLEVEEAEAPTADVAQTADGYWVGQAVEIEASKHWIGCIVTEISPDGLVRVGCPDYPPLSRGAGSYIVHDMEKGIRPATGQTGPATDPAEAGAPVQPVAQLGSMPTGVYTCYGTGGQRLAGWHFRVTGAGRYTSEDGAGLFTIAGDVVQFQGGSMDGQQGYNLRSGEFRIGGQANCAREGG